MSISVVQYPYTLVVSVFDFIIFGWRIAVISVVVSGNLVEPPKMAFENKAGAVYSVRFGSNTYKRDNQTKTTTKDVVWCSGLIPEKKIANIIPFLQKGTYVVANAPDATIKTFVKNDGETIVSLDLRYMHSLEAGNLDRGQQGGSPGAYAQPVQQQRPYQQQQQPPQGQYQQQPQQQYQQPPQRDDSLPF